MNNSELVVITGASAGIGKALALAFAKLGNPLLLISRHIEPLPELDDHEVMYKKVDVVDYKGFEVSVRAAEEKYGSVGCMINNAGLLNIGMLEELAIEKCTNEIDVLVKGVLNGTKIVLGDMAKRRSGSIINISSIADRKPFPTAVCYHASKHAIRSMTESLQMAQAKNNVRVMNIAPGIIKTNIHANMGLSFEEYCDALGNPTFIQPEELAEIIIFCWQLPQHICIRDLAVMPTDCGF